MKHLLQNDVLMCRTASNVLHVLPIAGLYTFLPKYLESQFRLTANAANIVAGQRTEGGGGNAGRRGTGTEA